MAELTAEEEYCGSISGIIYQAPEEGFVIAKLLPEQGAAPITIVGTIPGLVLGETLRVRGRWENHPRYGPQLRVAHYEYVRPATTEGIIAYLSGGLVKGIGPKLARALVAHFGEALLDILDREPTRLTEVPGIGEKKAHALAQAWQAHKAVHRIMLFLREHGAGPTLAARIYERYRHEAMHILEREPYRLARELRGVGFLTADRIARAAGIAVDDPERLRAGVLHVLREAAEDGHFFLPRAQLLERAQQLLNVSRQQLELALEQTVQAGEIVAEAYTPKPPLSPTPEAHAAPLSRDPAAMQDGAEEENGVGYFLPEALEIEKETAALLRRQIHDEALCAEQPAREREALCPRRPSEEDLRLWLQQRAAFGALMLSEAQIRAVSIALRHPVTIITGGPGTGKTTITRALAEAAVALGLRVALCSPTGRAAKRLSEASAMRASTIHRLLSWDPVARRFRYGPQEPLPVDLLIVDEASMLDVPLARDLLRATPRGAQIVFIGDADQLPSVGPGNFLQDIIASQLFPVVYLTEIYRQEEGGQIVAFAHEIRQGRMPPFVRGSQWRGEDCVWLERETAEEAAHAVLRVVTRSLPSLGFRPEEIQVITPMHRGPTGVAALNQALQAALNPPAENKAEIQRGEIVFREGDRVLQTTNDYDRNVFNGDIGQIEQIDPEARLASVRFDQGLVSYDFGALEELELAYALTIHKAQGSEYPAVVIALHSSHYIMLRRNLFYTALTRAERMAVIIGDRKGLWKAVRTTGGRERLTRLAPRLRGELPGGAINERLPFFEEKN